MHIYNKIHVLIITFSATCFGAYCAISRENFLYAQNYFCICDYMGLQLCTHHYL